VAGKLPKNISERLAFVKEFIKQQHAQAHDAGMQALDQAYEHSIADKQAANASAQSAQGNLDGSSLAPEHVQALSQMIQPQSVRTRTKCREAPPQ
jgi:hypothetical protein